MHGQRNDNNHCIFSESNEFVDNISVDIDSSGWIYFMPLGVFQPGDLLSIYKQEFGMSSNDEMRLERMSQGNNDDEHFIYQQYYSDIPVECGTLIEHFRECLLTSINGNFICGIDLDTTTNISSEDAIQIAISDLPGREFLWNDPISEAEYKEEEEDTEATFFPSPELVIDCDTTLVYKFIMFASDTTLTYKIDSKTGLIISKTSDVRNCFHNHTKDEGCNKRTQGNNTSEKQLLLGSNETTHGHTFDGVKEMSTRLSFGKHRLKTEYSDLRIKTRDAESGLKEEDWRKARKITMNKSDGNLWSEDEILHTQTHWAVLESYDFYRDVFDYSAGSSTRTLRVKSNVFPGSGAQYSDSEDWLTFSFEGDEYLGSNVIVGHEFTHFVIDELNNLGGDVSDNRDADNLNESFSDIFGTLIEKESLPASWDWIVSAGSYELRDIMNPLNSPSGSQPIYYHDDNWDFITSNSPHKNSGVQNRWFYLLSQGGVNNGILVNGIGIDKAAEITFRNLENYIEQTSDYGDSRNGAVEAAIDLFGECSTEHIQTMLAWEAVGVGTVESCMVTYTENLICHDQRNLPMSVVVNNVIGGDLVWTPIDFSIPWVGLKGSTTDWTFITSGDNNNTLTITDIPDNQQLSNWLFFLYEDVMGNKGVVRFRMVFCPNIDGPSDEDQINYCNDNMTTQRDYQHGEEDKKTFQIYPNPVKSFLSVSTSFINNPFSIYSSSGILVKSGIVELGVIEVDDLIDGYYTILIQTENNEIQNSRFIKME